jgi:formylglycine-generating enzyme required for sulfatase activity
MGNIFISYRREDSIATAGRIRDRLVQEFGRKRVFVDVDDIPHGRDFTAVLNSKVAECEVLLAIIGPNWAEAQDEKGSRRIDDPDDFVGVEIGAALARKDIAVIPVLVDGAAMPHSGSLPDQLKSLSRRNAIELRNSQFGSDVDRLIRSVKSALGQDRAFPWIKTAVAAALLSVAVLLALWNYKPGVLSASVSRQTGEVFRDCPSCPEMIVVPAGRFNMGAAEHELSVFDSERPLESPVHEVQIAKPFAVGRFAVTRDQFEEFVKATNHPLDGGCRYWNEKHVLDLSLSFRDPRFPGGPQAGDHPAVCVSHSEALRYTAWLSTKSGRTYRLLSDAEREYVTRAGTTSAFWWGPSITPDQANYWSDISYKGGPTRPARFTTVPVQSFAPNPWGLYQVHGNVAEWVADCWHPSLRGAPSDGSVWQAKAGDCAEYTVRNASINHPDWLRSAHRGRAPDIRERFVGFRVAQTL